MPSHPVPREGESLRGQTGRKVKPDYRIDHDTGCWEWLKAKGQRGYPSGRQYRQYYERAYGPVPADHDVHHKCKNPGCVNPEHLEAIHLREHDAEHFLGERAGGLTLDDVAEIRRMGTVPGTRAVDVAKQYGIHDQTVRRYWRGIRWQPEGLGGVKVMAEGRACERCGGPIGPEKMRHARFCTKGCQMAFNAERQSERRKTSRRAKKDAA